MEGRQEEITLPSLGERLAERVGEATFTKSTKLGLKNAEDNRPYFGKTIEDLKPVGGPAVVVVGGPSLHRMKSLKKLKASGFKGTIIAADGSMGNCLRHGIIPDYVVSVDGHPTRIVRWFGDTELETRPDDDYFARQDLDPAFWEDEKKTNRELIDLVDENGPKMKMLISTSVHPTVTKRAVKAKMDCYWWNPLYDDYEKPDSVTKKLFESNQIPCVVTGGNVGTSAWIFAHSVLGCTEIALVGMDLGYAPGTPLRRTQYYTELKELFGDRIGEAYIDVHNPYSGETWFTDPTYYWYRKVLLELAAEAPGKTYNCTEGGTLFAENIPFITLDEFTARFQDG